MTTTVWSVQHSRVLHKGVRLPIRCPPRGLSLCLRQVGNFEKALATIECFKNSLPEADQAGLQFDNNKTWQLKNARFSLSVTYEPRSDCMYIYSPVWNGMPQKVCGVGRKASVLWAVAWAAEWQWRWHWRPQSQWRWRWRCLCSILHPSAALYSALPFFFQYLTAFHTPQRPGTAFSILCSNANSNRPCAKEYSTGGFSV